MAWTFDPTLAQPRDQVRQLIGDTDADHQELADETLDFYLDTESRVLAVAMRCALDLAAKYARIVEVTVDHQTTRGQQIADNYRKMADRFFADLQREGAGSTVTYPGIVVTGIGDTCGPYDLTPLPSLWPLN